MSLSSRESVKYVSTHSRPKAAANLKIMDYFSQNVSTHSRPKAAAEPIKQAAQINLVSTHSRPKAAAARAFL